MKNRISKEMITESKEIVINVLEKYYGATKEEITQLSLLIENEDPENWTCGIVDEILPLFKEVRLKNKTND